MDEPRRYAIDPLKPRELEILRLIADGLSNQEIADRLYIAITTVRWYNRAIYSKLGVHSRTLAVAHAQNVGLLDGELTIDETKPGRTLAGLHQFPAQLTSFVGREREVAKVRQLLTSTRMLTLTGPGGTGKTQLAIQVAHAMQEYYPDGIWFVPLSAIRDAELVTNAIASSLGVSEGQGETLAESLVKHLQNKHLLLMVDNFEHVMPAASLMTDLLRGAARVKVMVTSREVLHLYGEQEYPVPPLTIPDWQSHYTLQDLASFEAVALFLQRAQAIQADFELGNDNVETIARICARLDGLPLALELAAARIKLLTPEHILERLEGGLGLPGQGPRDAPARQRTLQATIDWSYALLTDDEKALFARLSVFSGGWSLEAADAVCKEAPVIDILDGLASLLDKSLIQQTDTYDGNPRFTMLETIREYAANQLALEEADKIRNQHRDWYLQLAERGEAGLRNRQSRSWFKQLQLEEDNLRAALEWCRRDAEEARVGVRLAGALWYYWHMCGNYREGRSWLELLLSQVQAIATPERAQALNGAGVMAYRQGDYEEVTRLCNEALAVSQELADRDGVALALHYLAHVAQQKGDYDQATEVLAHSLAVYREQGNDWGRAQTLNCLGDLHRQLGHDDQAVTLLEEALTLQRQLDSQRGILVALHNLGHVVCRQQDVARATACFQESLELARTWCGDPDVVLCVAGFAGIAARSGQPVRAARLLGAVDALLPVVGYVLEPPDRADYDLILTETRVHLDEASFQAAWAEGQRMSLDQAVSHIHSDQTE